MSESGTIEARLESVLEFAEKECGHSAHSSRAGEGVLMEEFLRLRAELEEWRRVFGCHTATDAFVDDRSFGRAIAEVHQLLYREKARAEKAEAENADLRGINHGIGQDLVVQSKRIRTLEAERDKALAFRQEIQDSLMFASLHPTDGQILERVNEGKQALADCAALLKGLKGIKDICDGETELDQGDYDAIYGIYDPLLATPNPGQKLLDNEKRERRVEAVRALEETVVKNVTVVTGNGEEPQTS